MTGSILIVSYNNLSLTKAVVRTSLEQDTPCSVLVVDNGSTDGTDKWLHTKPVSTCFGRQQSLAACWNLGIGYFRHCGAPEVLVLNNDVEIPRNFYRLLRDCNKPFISGVPVDDRSRLAEVKTVDYLLSTANPHPSFSAFMIRREVVDKVGFFDEEYYPAYFEDGDMHVRMHRAGVEAVSVDLPFYHVRSSTLNNSSESDRLRIERGFEANKKRFREKYHCVPGTPEYEELFKLYL